MIRPDRRAITHRTYHAPTHLLGLDRAGDPPTSSGPSGTVTSTGAWTIYGASMLRLSRSTPVFPRGAKQALSLFRSHPQRWLIAIRTSCHSSCAALPGFSADCPGRQYGSTQSAEEDVEEVHPRAATWCAFSSNRIKGLPQHVRGNEKDHSSEHDGERAGRSRQTPGNPGADESAAAPPITTRQQAPARLGNRHRFRRNTRRCPCRGRIHVRVSPDPCKSGFLMCRRHQ